MTAETLAQKIERRDLYLAAEKAVLVHSQSYNAFGRTLTRANLPEIRAAIKELNAEIEILQQSSSSRGPFNKVTFGRPV